MNIGGYSNSLSSFGSAYHRGDDSSDDELEHISKVGEEEYTPVDETRRFALASDTNAIDRPSTTPMVSKLSHRDWPSLWLLRWLVALSALDLSSSTDQGRTLSELADREPPTGRAVLANPPMGAMSNSNMRSVVATGGLDDKDVYTDITSEVGSPPALLSPPHTQPLHTLSHTLTSIPQAHSNSRVAALAQPRLHVSSSSSSSSHGSLHNLHAEPLTEPNTPAISTVNSEMGQMYLGCGEDEDEDDEDVCVKVTSPNINDINHENDELTSQKSTPRSEIPLSSIDQDSTLPMPHQLPNTFSSLVSPQTAFPLASANQEFANDRHWRWQLLFVLKLAYRAVFLFLMFTYAVSGVILVSKGLDMHSSASVHSDMPLILPITPGLPLPTQSATDTILGSGYVIASPLTSVSSGDDQGLLSLSNHAGMISLSVILLFLSALAAFIIGASMTAGRVVARTIVSTVGNGCRWEKSRLINEAYHNLRFGLFIMGLLWVSGVFADWSLSADIIDAHKSRRLTSDSGSVNGDDQESSGLWQSMTGEVSIVKDMVVNLFIDTEATDFLNNADTFSLKASTSLSPIADTLSLHTTAFKFTSIFVHLALSVAVGLYVMHVHNLQSRARSLSRILSYSLCSPLHAQARMVDLEILITHLSQRLSLPMAVLILTVFLRFICLGLAVVAADPSSRYAAQGVWGMSYFVFGIVVQPVLITFFTLSAMGGLTGETEFIQRIGSRLLVENVMRKNNDDRVGYLVEYIHAADIQPSIYGHVITPFTSIQVVLGGVMFYATLLKFKYKQFV